MCKFNDLYYIIKIDSSINYNKLQLNYIVCKKYVVIFTVIFNNILSMHIKYLTYL